MLPPESQARRQALVHGLAIAACCWALFALLASLHATDIFDLKLLDWSFRLRGERRASASIAIVGIDDATIQGYHAWPLPRDAYALLLDALEEGGARAIGMDVQFPSDRNQDPHADALLAYVSATHDNIVHAIGFHAGSSDSAAGADAPGLEAVERRNGVVAVDVPAPEAADATLPYPDLATAAPLGHVNVTIDRDGSIRRLPFFIRYRGRLFPSLSLRLVGIAEGEPGLPEIRRAPGGADVRWRGGHRLRVPMDGDGSAALDFSGDADAYPNAHSMLEVLQWAHAGDRQRLRETFDGRIVLVGLTSAREMTDDIGTTPFSNASPLLYVHANAIDSCLRRGFIRTLPTWMEILILGTLAFLAAGATMALPLHRALLVVGACVAAVAGADQVLFALGRIDLPPVLPLLIPPVTCAAIASRRYQSLQQRSERREQEIREGRSVQQRFLPEALAGQMLSHYRIDESLGRGGMGMVYRGEDVRLRRPVAVKVLPGGVLADEPARRLFRREARVLARLAHAHIARLYDIDAQDGLDFLVLEYVTGETLAERLKRGPFPEAEVVRLGSQVLAALEEAHEQGIVHRDLKPSNVMVDSKGNAKVLDFGIARIVLDSSLSLSPGTVAETGTPVGTLPYMAPEILRGEKADPRTDVYGAGMILYEMATGRRPFTMDTPHELYYTILNQEPPEPRVLNRRVSERMEAIILRALEKDPARRYPSAAEMLRDLSEPAHVLRTS